MHFQQARKGYQFTLTEKGRLQLSERIRKGAETGQPIVGREKSAPISWVNKNFVIEEPEP
jgi:hypothetical protein